jgi:hypothetical protein
MIQMAYTCTDTEDHSGICDGKCMESAKAFALYFGAAEKTITIPYRCRFVLEHTIAGDMEGKGVQAVAAKNACRHNLDSIRNVPVGTTHPRRSG